MRVFVTSQGSALAGLINLLGKKHMPGLQNAVQVATNKVLKAWVTGVKESGSKEGWKREYIKSINIDRDTAPLESSVSASGMFMNFVEEGVKRFDMKPGLLNGPKARMGENGPYNIVFFRKGVPASKTITPMPRSIYQLAQKLDKGEVDKRYRVIGIGGAGPFTTANLKSKIYKTETARLGSTPKKHWKKGKDIYKGLVKTGSAKHTVYGTFRVVTKNSTGWIHPGVPASPVFKSITNKMQPEIKKILQEGLSQDILSGLKHLKGKERRL